MRQGYTPHQQQILALTRQIGELRLALETERDEHDAAEAWHADTIAKYHADLMLARAERDEAIRLRDLHWREVESLREWKDKLERERDNDRDRAATMSLMLDTIEGVATGQPGEIPTAVEDGWSTALAAVLALSRPAPVWDRSAAPSQAHLDEMDEEHSHALRRCEVKP